MTQNVISVSIVAFKTDLDELAKCLASLDSDLVSCIYIVDNSNQKYIADFCETYSKVVYIGNDNVGYGAGHNKAIRLAMQVGCKYHLVINSDVYFGEDILGKLVEYMDANEDVAQVQPKIIYPNGELQYTCRLLPSPACQIFRRFMPARVVKQMNNRLLLQFTDPNMEKNLPFHQGSFLFFRVECLKKIGLFDESFFMYAEDIDITRRMHKLYRTMYWPKVTIVHAHRAASYKSFKMLKIHMSNMIRYFNKWGWIFDKERKAWNQAILKEFGYKN